MTVQFVYCTKRRVNLDKFHTCIPQRLPSVCFLKWFITGCLPRLPYTDSTCYPQVTFYSAVILILILRVDVVVLDTAIKLLQSPPTKSVIINHCHHCNPCQPLSKCITITTINIASSCSNKLKSPSTPPFSHTCIIMTLTLLYVQCDN